MSLAAVAFGVAGLLPILAMLAQVRAEHLAADRPVVVDVRIDYSRKTQFTKGAVKTNLKRFDTRNKLRIVGRALWRKFSSRGK